MTRLNLARLLTAIGFAVITCIAIGYRWAAGDIASIGSRYVLALVVLLTVVGICYLSGYDTPEDRP